MQKWLIAAALVAAALLLDLRPGAAQEGPWCAEVSTGWGDIQRDCHYRSLEECRPNVIAGNKGFCTQNPDWPGWYGRAEGRPPPPRRHKRRD
jgi:hypothetical protein